MQQTLLSNQFKKNGMKKPNQTISGSQVAKDQEKERQRYGTTVLKKILDRVATE